MLVKLLLYDHLVYLFPSGYVLSSFVYMVHHLILLSMVHHIYSCIASELVEILVH